MPPTLSRGPDLLVVLIAPSPVVTVVPNESGNHTTVGIATEFVEERRDV